jgi:hypothetical protein
MRFHSKWPTLHVDLIPSVRATNPVTGEYDELRSHPGVRLDFKGGFAELKDKDMILKALRYLRQMVASGHKRMFEPVIDSPEQKEELAKYEKILDKENKKDEPDEEDTEKKKKS